MREVAATTAVITSDLISTNVEVIVVIVVVIAEVEAVVKVEAEVKVGAVVKDIHDTNGRPQNKPMIILMPQKTSNTSNSNQSR